jgi:hypothetical protein
MLRLKRDNCRELATAMTSGSIPVQTQASSSTRRRNLNSSTRYGSGSDLPTMEEVFGTERDELLSTSENEVLNPGQLAVVEAIEALLADKIAAIEGCVASAGRQTRGSPKRYASVKLGATSKMDQKLLLDAWWVISGLLVPVGSFILCC